MNIPQSLIHLGLHSHEAQLYTHLLKQPKRAALTVFSIAKNADMPRSTVYVTLQTLETKRLVSSYKKNNVLHYLVADPSRLTKDLEEKQDILASILPTLQSLSTDPLFAPSVQTFSGAKGVKIVFDDIFNKPREKGVREFHSISHPKLIKYMPRQFSKYMENKKKFNLKTKMMLSDAFKDTIPKEYISDSHRETRFLPSTLPFEGTLIIYGSRLALFSHRDNEVYSMIVDSPAITEMLDAVFICLWSFLPRG